VSQSPYVIEEGIPVPPIQRRTVPCAIRDTIWELDVGQTVLFPCAKPGQEYTHFLHVRSKVEFARRKLERKYSMRRDGDGVRVWRVA